MKKICFKYKEMLKKKGVLGTDRASISGKQLNQASVLEKVVEKSCDVLSMNLSRGKRRFSDARSLDLECTYQICPRKEWFSTYELFEGGTVMMVIILHAK